MKLFRVKCYCGYGSLFTAHDGFPTRSAAASYAVALAQGGDTSCKDIESYQADESDEHDEPDDHDES